MDAILADGRPLLLFTSVTLLLSAWFALFQAATGHFLPHDVAYLGMTAQELCCINECRIVHFMIHDRVAFGGALAAVAMLYLWLIAFPLQPGSGAQAWAWWVLAISGMLGFVSFLTYLGHGYLDTWHGVATLGLLPCFVVGMWRAYGTIDGPRSWRVLLLPGYGGGWGTRYGWGRTVLGGVSVGCIFAGLTIMTVGMTSVFVPQDLSFMGLAAADLHAINPRLVPLIAHDRAGFGGAVACFGAAASLVLWCAPPSRALWQILLLCGVSGFTAAIGVHIPIGYTDVVHLAPAYAGAVAFVVGLALAYPRCHGAVELVIAAAKPQA